ncbi:hypothetical protein P0082_07365 [Candidatus Haliotispira prima]|uniref:Transposase n=1 Tax=Candidatus Haliotispira prima TaxID=3034016 RepID=A0ABY8ME88_9SPIO|nr:hypothetical protein P0082_07365 [Candidatus Haliotispira prima]
MGKVDLQSELYTHLKSLARGGLSVVGELVEPWQEVACQMVGEAVEPWQGVALERV